MRVSVNPPRKCSGGERDDFARLVRQGFNGSDIELEGRIRAARRLAFHRERGTLVGIAGLKAPGSEYRNDVFANADTDAAPADYALELGWVYVDPERRGEGIATGLCRELLASASEIGVFATTHPDNRTMIRILRALGFTRTGRPFAHARRRDPLVLFLRRPAPAARRNRRAVDPP